MFNPMGTDDAGNILIPFGMGETEIPFARWQMVSTKIWDAPGPVAVRSIILTHKGEIFVTYAKEINDAGEYPTEYVRELVAHVDDPNDGMAAEPLATREEKRSYE